MNILDIIILVLLIPGIVIGLIKGFIEQVMGLIGLALGIFLSSRFTALVANLMLKAAPSINITVVKVIAFVVILVLVLLLITLLGKVLKKVIEVSLLGWLDHLLGSIFGLLKYMLVFALLVSLFNGLNSTLELVSRSSLENSSMWVFLENVSSLVLPYLKSLLGL